jgi:hypothetical protein
VHHLIVYLRLQLLCRSGSKLMLPLYALHSKLITQNSHKLTEIPSQFQWHMRLENKPIPLCSDCDSPHAAIGPLSLCKHFDYVIHLHRTC